MTTFNFLRAASFVGNRPYADVKLNPPHAGSHTYKCLVDTGADYLQLPAAAVAASGLNLATATNHSVRTAGGGTTIFKKLTGVAVAIEGSLVKVDVLFDPTNQALPLAGRGVLLAAFEMGFESTKWHWDT